MAGNLSVSLECEALAGVHTYEIDGTEQISKPFDFRVRVAAAAQASLDVDKAIAQGGALVFRRGETELRRVVGIVAGVRDTPLGDNRNYVAYEVHFVPRLWRLSMTQTTDIYMDLSVPDIIKKKLVAAGLTENDDFDFRLKGKYPPREFVVQYQETDLNFISRLAEHLGIYFFFEYGEREKVVFCDSKTVLKPVAEPKEITVSHQEASERDDLRVYGIEVVTTALPNKYIVRDYNYRSPGMDLKASAVVLESGSGEVIEYGAHFKTPEEGAKIARVRAEELRSRRTVFSGKSNAHQLASGAWFKLEGHHRGDAELLLTRVHHFVRQSVLNLVIEGEQAYVNDFVAIAKDVEYRPPREAVKPVVAGVVTGIVDAGQKSNYAELDAEGRYKIRFMYDTAERGEGQASRPVRMAQPSSGPGYGMHFPLRPGIEVILTCVNGDPDRPIIAGTVPNPETGSPVNASNQNRNVIKTGGGVEMNFDDTEGEKRLKISVPHEDTSFQLGSPNSPENGAMLSTADSLTQYAGLASTQVSNMSNLFAATAKFFASTDITAFAGISNKFDKPESIMGVIDAAADFAKDGLNAPKAWNDVGVKRAQAKAKSYGQAVTQAGVEVARAKAEQAKKNAEAKAKTKAAQAEMDRLAVNGASPPPDHPNYAAYVAAEKNYNAAVINEQNVANTQAQAVANAEANETKAKNEQAADPDASQAASDAAALDAQSNYGWRADLGKAGDVIGQTGKLVPKAYKTFKDIKKSAETIASRSATAASEAAKGGAAGLTASVISAAGIAGGLSRIGGSPGSLSKPWNIQGANGTAALVGMRLAIAGGPSKAALVGGSLALVGSANKALVHSANAAELTGNARAYVTSKALVDIDSKARVKMKSGASMQINAGASAQFTAKTSMHVQSKTAMTVKAGPKIDMKAAQLLMNGTSKVKIKTPAFSLTASNSVEIKGNSKTDIKTGSFSVQLRGGSAHIGTGSGNAKFHNGRALLKGGASAATLEGGGVKIKGPKMTLQGSGGVKVSGAKIELG